MVSLPLLVRQRTASRSALPRHVFHDSSHDTPIVASHIRTRDLCWSGACLRIEHDAPFDESRTVESLALTQVTKAFLTKPTEPSMDIPIPEPNRSILLAFLRILACALTRS